MKSKHLKELNDIRDTMINALEEPTKEKINGKWCMVLGGKYVTIEDKGEKYYFDKAFTVNGEDTDHTVLVCISHIKL